MYSKLEPMLKIKASIFVFLLAIGSTYAQSRLQVEGASPNLYLTHTVAAKENWYSIGRIYNQSPKEIAPYNHSSLDKPLAIGQKLKIPLTHANFSQDGERAADEVFVPLYHTVQEKEWMYRISTNYNKVAPANIEKWNNVKNDQLKPGMQLVVGFLKVKQAQSPLAKMGSPRIQVASGTPVVAQADNKKENSSSPAVKEEPVKPVETARIENPRTENPKSEPIKTEPKTTDIKEESRTAEGQPVSNTNPASHKGGAFRRLYVETGVAATGNAGIFRSTSGWNDGKYYALMNNVPVGTIVKVSFSSTNKSVYAKVLGQLPDMKESQGLTIRISDAAASELGVSMNKFYVDVKY